MIKTTGRHRYHLIGQNQGSNTRTFFYCMIWSWAVYMLRWAVTILNPRFKFINDNDNLAQRQSNQIYQLFQTSMNNRIIGNCKWKPNLWHISIYLYFQRHELLMSTVIRAILEITTSYFSNEESNFGVNIHSWVLWNK